MEKLEVLIAIAMAATATVQMICALILFKGGLFFLNETGAKRTTLQNLFCAVTIICFVTFIPALINDYFLTQPNVIIDYYIQAICTLVLGFIPLEAYVLQQVKLKAKHWIIVFWPILPLLLVPAIRVERHDILMDAVIIFSFFYFVLLTVYSYYKLRRWDKKMEDEYSNVSHKQTKWFRDLSAPLFLTTFLWIPMWVYNARWILVIYYVMLGWLYMRFTIYALRQEEFSFSDIEETTQEAETQNPAKLPVWVSKIDSLMKEDHVYRNDSLSSSEFAVMLGTNRTYLSKYLNESLHVNFYEFVNAYRLDEAEVLLKAGESDISEIAYSCGFHDRDAFYRIFKRRHGISPTEWVRKNS